MKPNADVQLASSYGNSPGAEPTSFSFPFVCHNCRPIWSCFLDFSAPRSRRSACRQLLRRQMNRRDQDHCLFLQMMLICSVSA